MSIDLFAGPVRRVVEGGMSSTCPVLVNGGGGGGGLQMSFAYAILNV